MPRKSTPKLAEPGPCPFCGSEKVKVRYDKLQNANWISCTFCYAAGPVDGNLQEAIKRWNAPAANITEIREAVLRAGEGIVQIVTGPTWL